eukprot:2327238-Amphidinium_carterae.1
MVEGHNWGCAGLTGASHNPAGLGVPPSVSILDCSQAHHLVCRTVPSRGTTCPCACHVKPFCVLMVCYPKGWGLLSGQLVLLTLL